MLQYVRKYSKDLLKKEPASHLLFLLLNLIPYAERFPDVEDFIETTLKPLLKEKLYAALYTHLENVLSTKNVFWITFTIHRMMAFVEIYREGFEKEGKSYDSSDFGVSVYEFNNKFWQDNIDPTKPDPLLVTLPDDLINWESTNTSDSNSNTDSNAGG